MTRTMKTIGLSLLAVAITGTVAAVSPQLMAARSPGTDSNSPAGATVGSSASAQSGMIDSYDLRPTIYPTKNPTGD